MRRSLFALVDFLIVAGVMAIAFWVCGAIACAQVYRIETVSHRATGQQVRGIGTAVCIGQQGQTYLFLTAKHNLAGVQSFGVHGEHGVSEGYRTSLHPTEDVASFCARGVYKPMPMSADEIPDGAPVQVCGFGPAAHGTPDQFCFAASMHGDTLTSKSHVIPGDSGGAAYVGLGEENVLVGIVSAYHAPQGSGYSSDRNDGISRNSLIVPIATAAAWLPTQYSNCPSCIPLTQPRPLQQRGQIRYRGTPPVIGAPSPARPSPQPSQIVIAPCQDDLRKLVAEYLAANPPAAGRDGAAGTQGPPGLNGRDAEVDYQAVVEAVVSEMPPCETTDPRVNALIDRLEALESRQPSSDLSPILSRLQALEERKHSQRVLLVDGSKKPAVVIDDETYVNEPIILDVRKFMKSGD